MTRLTNPDSPNGDARPGPNAAVLDKILLLSGDRKRARPIPSTAASGSSAGSGAIGPGAPSSLEYTPDKTRGRIVSTHQNRRKKADTQQHQQEQQQMQQQQQYVRPTTTTRARGSSGIPPRTLDMSDLEGMDAEQILQALYENPELVAEASERFDKESEKKKSGKRQMNKTKKPKKKGSEYYRTDDGRVLKEGVDRLDMLKKEGFPYIQWIVISLTLGAGIYQIYKCIKQPSSTKATKAVRGAKKVKGAKPASASQSLDKAAAKIEGPKKTPVKAKSAPQKRNVPKKKAPEKKPEVVKVVEKKAEVVVEEEKVEVVVEKATAPQTNAPTKKAKKPKAKAATKAKKESPDSISTDGSSSTATESKAPKASLTPVGLEALPTDEGEWQTVGVKSAPAVSEPVVKEPTPAPASKNGSSKKESVKEEAAPIPTEEAPLTNGGIKESTPASTPVDAVTENKENGKTAEAFKSTTSKKSKKKKKAAAAKNPPKENHSSNGGDIETVTSTDSDAALALQLQTEEEHMALSEDKATKEAGDDAWEEVATKKKKPVPAAAIAAA
jgi:hypothetical protein